MGVYMGYLKNTGINIIRFSDRSVLFESADSEDRRLNWPGQKN